MTTYVIPDDFSHYIESRTGADSGGHPLSYPNSREGTGGLAVVTTINQVGQFYNSVFVGGPFIFCSETFVSFDTSDFYSISSAVLSFALGFDNSATDFVIEARAKDFGATVEAADWVAGSALGALTLVADLNTSGLPGSGRFDLNDVALVANLNIGGQSRFVVSSSRHRGNNAPAADVGEYVNIGTARLTVDGSKTPPSSGWHVGSIAIS